MLTDLQIHAIQRLPRTPQVWQGDLRSLESFATVQGLSEGPLGVFWVDEATATPRAIHLCATDHLKPQLLLDGLVEALLSPVQGNPGRPRQVVVCRKEYQLFLRGVLQDLDIQVEYRSQLLLLDQILLFLADQLAPLGQPPNDLPEDQLLGEVELTGLNELYAQTVALWRRAPWKYLRDNPPIEITLNQWGVETLHASILGGAGLMAGGVVFYYSQQDFENLLVDPREDEIKLLAYDALYVHFLTADELHPQLIEQFETFKWPRPNKDIYADVGRLVKSQGIRPLGRTEVLIVQTALCALNQFLSKQKRYLQAPGQELISHTSTLLDPPRKIQVQYQPLPPEPHLTWNGPLRDDLFPDGMSVTYDILEWPFLNHLQSKTSIFRPALREIPSGTMGFPVIILGLKSRTAQKICRRLLEENFLGLIFAQQTMGGEEHDCVLGITQKGGVYLILDEPEDPLHRSTLQEFYQAQKLCNGGHGLIVVKERQGRGFRVEDVVGVFVCNSPTPPGLTLNLPSVDP